MESSRDSFSFTTFLFGAVAVSGVRVLAYAKWTRRDRFIATAAFSFGLAPLAVPNWFSYFFTYSGNNKGLSGLIQAIVLIVEESYLIAGLIAVTLNAVLPEEKEEDHVIERAEIAEWNQPGTLMGSSNV